MKTREFDTAGLDLNQPMTPAARQALLELVEAMNGEIRGLRQRLAHLSWSNQWTGLSLAEKDRLVARAGAAPRSFRPLDDGSLTNLADEPVVLEPGTVVRLAHDSNVTPEQSARCQLGKDHRVQMSCCPDGPSTLSRVSPTGDAAATVGHGLRLAAKVTTALKSTG